MKKFNGHRCERRNLTDLVLGTGPDGTKRAQPKAKKRPKNYTKEPEVNKMNYGGPFENYNFGNVQLEGTAGQMPNQVSQFLQEGNNANLVSTAGQTMGTMIANESAGESPTDGFRFGEGAGDFISGATNPLAMALGPWGMLAFGVGNVAKGIYEEKRDLKEYREQQQEEKDKRTALNAQAAQNFSNQALSTYDQSGLGGGFYKHGGHITKFYPGGPANGNPPSVMPGMEAYAQYANLNPTLNAAVQNMPVSNDRLTSYTDQQLAEYERLNEQARINESAQNIATRTKEVMSNPDVAMDAGQLLLQGVAASEVPVVSQAAGGINTAMYAGRAGYKAYKGDYANAGIYGGLAGLSALGMVPVLGTAADLTAAEIAAGTVLKQGSKGMRVLSAPTTQRAIHGAEHVEHLLHPAVTADKATNVATGGGFKPMYAATGSFEKGGPVDYETEKSEVILASPNDPPVAVGQGKYTQVSQNLYKGNGPSHANGGIPTKGATQAFVDAGGKQQDSPYVFSDAKEMRFDATDILSMIR